MWRGLCASLLVVFFVATAYAQDQSTPLARPTRIRVGANVAARSLIKKVDPEYPAIAKAAQVGGTVVLHIVIAKDGSVAKADFISGPPLLMQSTMDAVRQWSYKPMLLKGNPVEVDTTVRVVFSRDEVNSDSTSSQTKPVDPQLHADILRLLDVGHFKDAIEMGVKTVTEPARARLIQEFPDTPNREKIVDDYLQRIVDLVQSPEFADRIADVYAKYLSDEDVKSLLQFYESPSGQHFSAAELSIANDVGQAGRELAQQKSGAILSDLCAQYPELRGRAEFCPVEQEKNPAQ